MPGKKYVILGSGDIGMIMARRITIEGGEVLKVVEALPYLTGLRRNYVQCLQDFGIPLQLSHTVVRIDGYERVEGVEIAPVDASLCPDMNRSEWVACDTLLLSVGLIPENELSRKIGVELDPLTGGPIVDQYCQTSVYGVFAAGNVVHIYDLVDDVTDQGEQVGRAAARFARALLPWQNPSLVLSWKAPIRSVVPQRLLLRDLEESSLEFFLRVSQPCETAVTLCLREDKKLIYEKKLPYVRPAEMIHVTLERDLFQRWQVSPPANLSWEVVYDS